MAKFEIYTDNGGEFRFRLVASNGQNILASEGYKTKASCLNGIESVKKNAQDANKFERVQSKSGKEYFNLKSSNGQVVGTSQMYTSSSGMENGVASVMKNAPDAEIAE